MLIRGNQVHRQAFLHPCGPVPGLTSIHWDQIDDVEFLGSSSYLIYRQFKVRIDVFPSP